MFEYQSPPSLCPQIYMQKKVQTGLDWQTAKILHSCEQMQFYAKENQA